MANRFPGETCVLCPNFSEGVGEHSWPSWFIEEFRGQGPFNSAKGTVPYTKRDGVTPVTSTALPSVHVPMCTRCNRHLGTTMEEPAKDVIRRVLPWSAGHVWPTVTADEAAALARWFLKIGLLSAHPKGVHDNPHVHADPSFPRFDQVEPEWMDWMRTGDTPPDAFSVYVTRRSVTSEQPWEGEKLRVIIPDVHVGNRSLHYMSRSFGIRALDVNIVWHPGWPIRHPLVEDGRATALWPNPSTVDFGSLPEVHPDKFRFYPGIGPMQFSGEQFERVSQTPLHVGMDPFASFFGDPTQPHGPAA